MAPAADQRVEIVDEELPIGTLIRRAAGPAGEMTFPTAHTVQLSPTTRMSDVTKLDQYQQLFLAAAYIATDGVLDREFDPEHVAEGLRQWTGGTGKPYASQLVAKGCLRPSRGTMFRFTEDGRKLGWAHAHRVDVEDNVALLAEIYRKSYGRTSAVVDATAIGNSIKLHGTRLNKLIRWLGDNDLVEIQTPDGFEPVLVKLRQKGRERAREEDYVVYWFWNNQTLGAISGSFVGAILGLLPKEPDKRKTAVIACAAGLILGTLAALILPRLPGRLRWKVIGWISFGAAVVVFTSWLFKG